MEIFKLPDLGEGLADAEIVKWHIKEGDVLEIDQPLVSMETAKAVVEVPSPIAGIVNKLYGKPGDIVATGSPLVEFANKVDAGTVVGKLDSSEKVLAAEKPAAADVGLAVASKTKVASTQATVKIMPAARALAKKLQVDLNTVTATGPNGTITVHDIENFQQWQPVRGARRTMSEVMAIAHQTVVPVTIMDDAIISSSPVNNSEHCDITVTVIQALVVACKQEPSLNAWFDGKAMTKKLIPELNLGIAVDTQDGLFVPVLKNANVKSKEELRTAVNDLKQKISTRTIKPEALKDSSFVLSNFGKFAGRYANPIVVPPTVAILGVGRMRQEPVIEAAQIIIKTVLPLALTIDHRACTGGEAARFLQAVIKNI